MKSILSVLLLSLSFSAFSVEKVEEKNRCNEGKEGIECGWHFGYIDPLGELKEEEKKPEKKQDISITINSEEKEQDCSKADEWTESCGFVDPGTDFDFQSKQRDVFLKGLVMKSGSQKAVKNMQKYNKWLVSRAIEASRIGEFNLVQDPELSADVKRPTNAFGLSTLLTLRQNTTEAVIEEITSKGGMLVWFTRSDCVFCHKQRGILNIFSKKYDLPIRNASLDEACFNAVDPLCLTAPLTLGAAERLNVQIVPSLFIYIPEDDSYIRISNGLETVDVIANRIKNFFLGIKSAHINGIMNSEDGAPNVDFKNKESTGLAGTTEIK
ncbi:conjugal transfer protein TraF [Pseudoalteromonas marina]|uniref:Conjugal transfer protein TraF n=1 Tax=Pseudoalteromonas marina TaxID=267375 RepID=A0ABT9FC78_9GAMM|nr:conjugal transfer protein TraF [Pseudoalteromonas marina]MDP2564384.1 conjugal transfer protein TraF [Pseudoalteromonas marina]